MEETSSLSLGQRTWKRAAVQGLACGAGAAIGMGLVSHSWIVAVIGGAVVCAVLTFIFGVVFMLLRREGS
jgi:hypothetical protein